MEVLPSGRRVAVALRGVERGDISSGAALAAPGMLMASARLDARVALLASALRAIRHGEVLRLLLGTAEVGARLHLLDRDRLEPGATAEMQLRLDVPLAAPAREPFLPRLAGLPPAAFIPFLAEAEGLRLADSGVALELAALEAVETALRRDPLGPGPNLITLRPVLSSGAPLEGVVARLVAAGALALSSGRLRRRDLDAEALLPEADRALLAEVEHAFRAGHLTPPGAATVVTGCRRRAARPAAPDAVQQREILFHQDALEAACRAIRAHFATRPDGFLAGECGRLLGVSRRFSIPLLERLDVERFTRRTGDRRHVAATEPAPARRG